MLVVLKPGRRPGSYGRVGVTTESKGISGEGLAAAFSHTPSSGPCILCLAGVCLFRSIVLCASLVVWLSDFGDAVCGPPTSGKAAAGSFLLTPAGATVAARTVRLADSSPLRPGTLVPAACPAPEKPEAEAKPSSAGTGPCDSPLLELVGFKFGFRDEAKN